MAIALEDVSERVQEGTFERLKFTTLGLGFLALAKVKFHLTGYTPKPAVMLDACVNHDIHIAQKFLTGMERYGVSIKGKDVLELGPGEDLGTGAYLMHAGAKSYTAFDAHDNANRAPLSLYTKLHDRGLRFHRLDLKLKVDPDFSLLHAFRPNSFDVVVSSSAFEHFDDPVRVLRELQWVLRPGGVLIASVDLQTHSRWIRDADPNNIYRYPEWLYRLFQFPGQCNRVRMREYHDYLTQAGWRNIQLRPGDKSVFQSRARVDKRFSGCEDMNVLAFSMFAIR